MGGIGSARVGRVVQPFTHIGFVTIFNEKSMVGVRGSHTTISSPGVKKPKKL